MLMFSHLAINLILIKILNLAGSDIILALIFGNLVDLDHLFHLKLILKDWRYLYNDKKMLRTFIQEPISLIWILPLCLLLRNFIPLIFWSVHVLMDYLVVIKKKPFWPISNTVVKTGVIPSGSRIEWMISSSTFFLVVVYYLI